MTLGAWKRQAPRCAESHFIALGPEKKGTGGTPPTTKEDSSSAEDAALVFAIVTADEGAHIALESDGEVEALPHPLARTPISDRVASALAPFGVAAGDDTFTVAEKLARVNPLLRHRVF